MKVAKSENRKEILLKDIFEDFNKDDLEYKYSFKKLEAPVKKGEKVGDLKVYYQDKLLYQEEYATTKEIEKDTFSYILGVVKDFMFPYGLAIILVIIYILILRMKKRWEIKFLCIYLSGT